MPRYETDPDGWPRLQRDYVGLVCRCVRMLKNKVHVFPEGTLFHIRQVYRGRLSLEALGSSNLPQYVRPIIRSVHIASVEKVTKTVDDWEWRYNEEYNLLELFDKKNDQMLAYIEQRNHYCDRGHYRVGLQPFCMGTLELDAQDGREIMYYMKLKTAIEETEEFLCWRIHKKRAEEYGSLLSYALAHVNDSGVIEDG